MDEVNLQDTLPGAKACKVCIPDPREEAIRLAADPEHQRRKVAYMRSLPDSGRRRARIAELEEQIAKMEQGRQ